MGAGSAKARTVPVNLRNNRVAEIVLPSGEVLRMLTVQHRRGKHPAFELPAGAKVRFLRPEKPL